MKFLSMTIDHIIPHLAAYQRKEISNTACRRAAVLIPIVQMADGLHLLLTKRTESVEHHKGQISFPGGAVDNRDSSLIETALRETEEEIGLKRDAVQIIGIMDDLQTPTQFVVTPIVGYIKHLPALEMNKEEVAELLFLPLNDFVDTSKHWSEMRELDGMKRMVHFFDVWKEPVWGATAHFIQQMISIARP